MNIDLKLGCSSSINAALTVKSPSFFVSTLASTSTLYKTLKYVDERSTYATQSTKVTELTDGNFFAPSVQVRFQSSDIEVARTWSSQLIAYAHANDSSGPSMVVPNSASDRNMQASVAPSTIAAIILGALIGLGSLCGVILIMLRRRRKPQLEHRTEYHLPVQVKAEVELGTREESMLADTSMPAEADAHREVREMPLASPSELPDRTSMPTWTR